jgi:hypothetical protein
MDALPVIGRLPAFSQSLFARFADMDAGASHKADRIMVV